MAGDELDNGSLESMAEILAKLKPSQQKKLKKLMDAKSKGIKRVRISEKISMQPVGEDGTLSSYEEDTDVDDDGRIVHKKTNKIKLFDCGHPATKENFGHIADVCGHTACKECVKENKLVCWRKGCMQKMCPLDGCTRYVVADMNLCKKHARELKMQPFLALIGLENSDIWKRDK